MTCDRYWREGILLVERGLQDPHREGCDDCARAHASRDELVEILPLIGEGYTGDPRWQANVWQRIDGNRVAGTARWRWLLDGALATACILLLWLGLAGPRPSAGTSEVALIEFEEGDVMRARAVHVDDWISVTLGPAAEARVYRDAELMLRCGRDAMSTGCVPKANGMVLRYQVSVIGQYDVLVVNAAAPPSSGNLDKDRAALMEEGIKPAERKFSVH